MTKTVAPTHLLGVTWNWGMLFSAVMIFNTLNFLICYFCINDLSIVDITWGLMHLIPVYILLFDRIQFAGSKSVTDV